MQHATLKVVFVFGEQISLIAKYYNQKTNNGYKW